MYGKDLQTSKKIRTHIVCSSCGKKRLMKFYSSKQARKCSTCKAKAKRLKRQSSKGYIEVRKDTVWANFIKDNAGRKCEYCGTDKTLNAHHIFSRSNKQVRHDLDNGISLCVGHHKFNSKFSAHLAPLEFILWLREKRGEEWFERLRAKARKVK